MIAGICFASSHEKDMERADIVAAESLLFASRQASHNGGFDDEERDLEGEVSHVPVTLGAARARKRTRKAEARVPTPAHAAPRAFDASGAGSSTAFMSVHDMIHAAIAAYGTRASLKEIYAFCEIHGRIIYKKTGGSRWIAENQHYKSQIRHALYTSGKFARCANQHDHWEVLGGAANAEPRMVSLSLCQDSGQPPQHQQQQQQTQGGVATHTALQGKPTQATDSTTLKSSASELTFANKRKRTTRAGRAVEAATPAPPIGDWNQVTGQSHGNCVALPAGAPVGAADTASSYDQIGH